MKKVMVLLSIIVLMIGFCYPVLAEDTSITSDQFQTRYSIGVNNLPWQATSFSLRWWNSEDSGHEFSVNTVSLFYQINDNGELHSGCDLTGLRFDWLHRRKVDGIRNCYFIWGDGLGFGYSSKSLAPTITENIGTLYAYFPIGVEHFFLEKYPNISYSVQLDIYGGLSYQNEQISGTPSVFRRNMLI